MGKILLEGIEVMVRIGLLEEELYAPQDLLVSLELESDFSKIAKTMKWKTASTTVTSLKKSARSHSPMMERRLKSMPPNFRKI